MSTRCHIIIKWDDKETFIYHHHDGYPEGVGTELKEILKSCTSYDWETIAEKILGYDDQYEEDSGIHGDEDYIYEIEAKDTYATLKCYSYSGSYRKDVQSSIDDRDIEIQKRVHFSALIGIKNMHAPLVLQFFPYSLGVHVNGVDILNAN